MILGEVAFSFRNFVRMLTGEFELKSEFPDYYY